MGSLGGDPEDSFAILLALNSPELEVEGLTIVQGNVPVALRPSLVDTKPAFVTVETEGWRTQGATVAYLNPITRLWESAAPNTDVALQVRAAEFEQLFRPRVLDRLLP